jgi:hypothetical protein
MGCQEMRQSSESGAKKKQNGWQLMLPAGFRKFVRPDYRRPPPWKPPPP